MAVVNGSIARDLVTGAYVRVERVRRAPAPGAGGYPAGTLVASVTFATGDYGVRALDSLEALTLEEQTAGALEAGLDLPTKNQP